eukprot:UN00663
MPLFPPFSHLYFFSFLFVLFCSCTLSHFLKTTKHIFQHSK